MISEVVPHGKEASYLSNVADFAVSLLCYLFHHRQNIFLHRTIRVFGYN